MATRKNKGFETESEEDISNASSLEVVSYKKYSSEGFIKKSELKNVPNTLPHGFFVHGKRYQVFKIAPYHPDQDSKFTVLYSNPKATLRDFVQGIFPLIIESIEGIPFATFAKSASCPMSKLIDGMPLSDAMTIILNTRYSNVGSKIQMEDQCPNCKTNNKDNPKEGYPYHDISSISLGIIPKLNSPLRVEVTLKNPITIDGDVCDRVQMSPLRIGQLPDYGKVKRGKQDRALLQAQVRSIPQATSFPDGKENIFDDYIYSLITDLKDRNRLLRASAELNDLAPDLQLVMTCSNCMNEWESALDWQDLRRFMYSGVDEDDDEENYGNNEDEVEEKDSLMESESE